MIPKSLAEKIVKEREYIPTVKTQSKCKILHISDLHIPYQEQELLDYVINEHAGDDTILVINGDLIDAVHISTFTNEARHSQKDEILQANQLVKELSTRFMHVFVLDGNHERRLQRYIGRNARPLEFLMPVTFNFYVVRNLYEDENGMLIPGEPIENVTYVPQRFFLIDNILFSHPQNYSGTPGTTVKKVINSALSNYINFDIAVIGHTHQVQTINYMGKIGIEAGCLSQYRDYITNNARMDTGMQLGYATFEMDNGRCISFAPVNLTFQAMMLTRGAELVKPIKVL